MRLALPEDVVTALGVAANGGSSGNAERALDSVTPFIEDMLESALHEASLTDYFTPPVNLSSSTRFQLSRMFVVADSVVVRESLTDSPLLVQTDGDVVLPSDYFLDAEKGRITFRRALNTTSHSLSVTYDAGFAEDSETHVATEIPKWLYEAAIKAAVLALNVLPSIPAHRKEKTVTNATKAISSSLYASLSSHLRTRLLAVFPDRVVVNE